MSTKTTSRLQKGNSLLEFPENFVIIDIETTGLSPLYDSIIEVSALKIENNIVTDTFTSLINPHWPIDEFITELTGITNEMLQEAPEENEVLEKFKAFISDSVLVGHNVNFDINFLYDSFEELFGIPLTNDFIDTMRIAKRLLKDLEHHRLSDLCEHFEICYNNAHRALNDCKITLEVFNKLKDIIIKDFGTVSSFANSNKYKAIDLRTISPEVDNIDTTHPLFGKVCVFTGTLENMTRAEAAQIVVNYGGICENGITKKTNFLILGNNDYCKSIKDGKSNKQKTAEKYKLKGFDIEIIPEEVFYDFIAYSLEDDIKKSIIKFQDLSLFSERFQLQKNKNNAFTICCNKLQLLKISFKKDKILIQSKFELKSNNAEKNYNFTIEKDDEYFYEISASNPYYGILDSIIHAIFLDIDEYIKINYQANPFGCCSSYVACSDALKCIHPDLLYSIGCEYRKHLESGKIFYGKNKNI